MMKRPPKEELATWERILRENGVGVLWGEEAIEGASNAQPHANVKKDNPRQGIYDPKG